MKSFFLSGLRLLALLILVQLLAGCGGTETGNPARPAEQNPVLDLMEAICGKLASCAEDVVISDCRLAVMESSDLIGELGTSVGDYSTFIDLVLAVDRGLLDANPDELDLCLATIEALACDSEAVQSVVVEEGGFRNLEQMIPDPQCSSVFGMP